MVIALALVVVAGNVTASRSDGTSVTTCYNKKSGALRYLVKGKCKKSETTLNIGQVGPQGPAGTSGAQGATGPAGAQGATGPAGLDGAAANMGATGPAGATGATGPAGYSEGFSASGVFSDGGTYTPTLELDNTYKFVFNTGAMPLFSGSSSAAFDLTGTKDVQVTAKLMFRAINGDDVAIESGFAYCTLFKGVAGADPSTFTSVIGSDTALDVSETKVDTDFVGSMTMIGWTEMSGSNDFAVRCTLIGSPSDVRLVAFTVNAIAIG